MGIAQREVSVAGTLCRLMSAGLVGLSLGIAPAVASPNGVPVTANAGMGTGDVGPVDAAPSSARATGGIDGAGNSAVPLTTPLPPAAAPASAPAAAPRASAPSTVAAPVRGGIDSAGDGAAPAAAQVNPTPTPAAPAQTATPAPVPQAPTPQPVEAANPLAPVGEAIAALIATPEAITTSKKEQEALAAFYGARQNMPVFVSDTGLDARGKAVIARFDAAAEDGLDPADYQVPLPKRGATAADLARTELKIAVAAMTYARHAQAGRFDPGRISSLVTPVRDIPDPTAALTKVAYAPDANAALAAFNPPHAGYRALKAQLARANGNAPTIPAIPPGPQVKPGASDPRMPTLRARLGVTGRPANDLVYDPALVDAVKAFQESAKIKPTGIIGPQTLAALNVGATGDTGSLRNDVIANMERWRWLPRDLGEKNVMVNIPEFMVRINQDGRVIHETRVVVGKPETPTPLLTREMQYIVVNPAWNIPPSIARNEMMPLLRSDPGALARRGIQVVRNGSGGYSFRQDPGERNALGRIKFMFPNDHSVYLHDTPSKALFQNDRRAYSHGCVRVYEPLKFGEVIFNMGLPGDTWSEQRISKMFGGSERYINLKQRFPVHIVYFNALVDGSGRLVMREDLYGINAATKTFLGLDGKQRIADSATPKTTPRAR